MLYTNVSFYVFIGLFFSFRKLSRFRINSFYQFIPILFGIGAFISTICANEVNRSLIVLPNYLYWALTLILFYNYRNYLDFKLIRKAIFNGLVLLNLYYWFLERTLKVSTPITKSIHENGYAILMICFAPTAINFVLEARGKSYAIIFAFLAVILGFMSGSRAGAILIAAGSFLTLYGNSFSPKRIILLFTIGLFGYLILFKTDIASAVLMKIDPDVHAVIYASNQVFEEDQSMLLRRAMVEKGIILFENEPLTGLGLNNWTEYEVDFKGDFEGAERIIYKQRLEKFSAHNSYAALLGEGGLLVFVPFVLILLTTILKLLSKFGRLDQYQQPILWGIIMMAIHIYFISGMSNSFTWYLLALGVAVGNRTSINQ
jgi:hypothetical protein